MHRQFFFGSVDNRFRWSQWCSGATGMTVIHCNGNTFKPLPFYPVCPLAGHSSSKYSSPSYHSWNSPAACLFAFPRSSFWTPQRHLTDCNGIFLSSVYRRVMHGSNFCGLSHRSCWITAGSSHSAGWPWELRQRETEGERTREREREWEDKKEIILRYFKK